MKRANEGFSVKVSTNDMPELDFSIIPFVKDGEVRYEVLLREKPVGTLHKTFEQTWEWLDGSLTLSDAEEIGGKIEARFFK